MLPEPNATSQSSQNNRVENPSHTNQYGVPESDTPLSHRPLAERGRAYSGQAASSDNQSTRDLGAAGDMVETALGRLNSPQPTTSSLVDDVSEYERASILSPNKKNVTRNPFPVRGKKQPNKVQLGLCDLSNEILTHVLSHLPPSSLSDVALVSKRFHELVTTPHAWRVALSRYFPGSEALNTLDSASGRSDEEDTLRVERRVFTRLTALASWRSEYILRTRLLRALGRGKPLDVIDSNRAGSSRSGHAAIPLAQVTYSSNLAAPITNIDANFGTGLNKKLPKFIHGADEYGAASISDPGSGKIEPWGSLDAFSPRQFTDLFPGDALYGLGAGDVVGVPNVMDISHLHGMVYGEGLIAGVLWYRSTEEKRGRALLWTMGANEPEKGIPALMDSDAVCSVWIAKTSAIPDLTEGLIGILAGSSTGVLTAYSLGTNGVRDRRLERGEITARWILSPGVPIIAIVVDKEFSMMRFSRGRIWAAVLNALGEVFFLTEIPKQADLGRLHVSARTSESTRLQLEKVAWATGRTVQWQIVESTRRVAKPDPFDRSGVDGSYSPSSSSNQMHLNPQQLASETKEISTFLRKKPKEYQKLCHGWNMQRKLEIDFASSDDFDAGEAICVIDCGLGSGQVAQIKRHMRWRFKQDSATLPSHLSSTPRYYTKDGGNSIFGGSSPNESSEPLDTPDIYTQAHKDSKQRDSSIIEEWRTSTFDFGSLRAPEITATAIDKSKYATLTVSEDPLLFPTLSSEASSPMSSPLGKMSTGGSIGNIPGQRARFLAIGTKTGTIFMWNMRAPVSNNVFLENTIKPIRIIYSDSPQISCLALTALYLVHGGNDGLVQAWDPLASTNDPIRTLNSRFSSRARRRLIQAEASPAGVGINLFAAGAICLDPDPTVLRGMVSLGTHLRYWSYSSLGADHYKGKKRRPHRSERGSNQGADRFSGTGRSALKDYIANEKLELEREKRNKLKEEERLAGRFGLDLLGPGASEDEILAYATMLSEEAAHQDELKRKESEDRSSSSDTVTEEVVASPASSAKLDEVIEDESDDDFATAIRLSLEETSSSPTHLPPTSDIPIKFSRQKRSPTASPGAATMSGSSKVSQHKQGQEAPSSESDDLEYALQLSLAEEQSRVIERAEPEAKGKGKERAL